MYLEIHEDVKIIISLKKLMKSRLSVEQYLFIYMFHIGEEWKLSAYLKSAGIKSSELASSLIGIGFLKKIDIKNDSIAFNNLEVTNVLKKFFKGITKSDNVEDWIADWYELWPIGVKTGGYYLKTDKKGSLRKMKKFLVSYPEYDRNTIIEATKNYLIEQSIKGYPYTKLAPYFIDKDGLSILAGECEALIHEDIVVTNSNDGFGQEEL